MIRITPVAFVLVLLVAPFASAQSPVEKGKAVYADQKCSVCHSIGGVGNKKGPLDEVGKLSAADLRSWITNAPDMAAKAKSDRKPPMKAYTALAKEDVDGLVAYMATLKK